MLFYRNRIEEDLSRIYNEKILLPGVRAKNPVLGIRRPGTIPKNDHDDCVARGVTADGSSERPNRPFEKSETIAMIIAVFSLIGPYIFTFIGIIGLLVLWINS